MIVPKGQPFLRLGEDTGVANKIMGRISHPVAQRDETQPVTNLQTASMPALLYLSLRKHKAWCSGKLVRVSHYVAPMTRN